MTNCEADKSSAQERFRNRRKSANRQPNGKFRAGHGLAGPGRPVGSRNKATVLLEKMLAQDGEEVVRTVLEKAKAGDMAAAKMVLDRIVPIARGRPVQLHFQAIDTASEVSKAHSAAIMELAKGNISPEEAATIANVLEAKRRAIEMVEIEARLTALERHRRTKQ